MLRMRSLSIMFPLADLRKHYNIKYFRQRNESPNFLVDASGTACSRSKHQRQCASDEVFWNLFNSLAPGKFQ